MCHLCNSVHLDMWLEVTFFRFALWTQVTECDRSLLSVNMRLTEGKLHGSKEPGVKTPLGSSPPFYAKQRTLSPRGKKKWTLRLTMPSSQPIQPLADLQNSLPSHLRDNYSEKKKERDNYSEQPWRAGPLKTVAFHIYAYICLLFAWVSAAAH